MGSSYYPYNVWGDEAKGIYVVRLAPFKNGVEAQWVGDGEQFEVVVSSDGKAVRTVVTTEKKVKIEGLEENTEYSLKVVCAQTASGERLFRTGDYLGKVVNYLHPQDLCYSFSGRYVATPSIVRFRNALYVSMDVFRGADQRGAFNLTLLYRSEDDGESWEYVADIVPCFWGTLFVAGDKLCILGVDSEAGSLVVMESKDGMNWSDPTYLLYGCGTCVGCGMHKTATPYCEKDGKIYFALEYGGHGVKRFDTLAATLDLSKDVCEKSAWTFSKRRMIEFEWGGDKNIRFAIEGNMVERGGELFILSRFAYQRALMLKFDPKEIEKTPEFYKVIDFRAGHCKFFVQKAAEGLYYAMGNTGCYPRHVIELYCSKDLEHWETLGVLEDISALSVEEDGVQYPSFIIEDGQFKTVLRNALNGAHTFHDSNAIVFKKYPVPNRE
ncbi:MAG: hypothetical protein IJY62_00795 [Clostridia bacterium]|nr:hypothetical protein [Clostridia bacterium]